MKKNGILLFQIGMVVMLALGGFYFCKNLMSNNTAYNKYVKAGDDLYKKEIYIDAIDCYEKAIDAKKHSPEPYIKLADSYLNLGMTDKYESVMANGIQNNKNSADIALKLANYYIGTNDYENAYKVLSNASDVKDNKEILELKKKYQGFYDTIGKSFTEALPWCDGYLPVKIGNLWGMVNDQGNLQIDCIYDWIGFYDSESGVIPVKQGDKTYYIDIDGYKKLVGNHEYNYLGSFSEKLAPASYNGKAGYIDINFKEYAFNYNQTTPFLNGVAAVRNGNKWALINSKMKQITDFKYDEIKLDGNLLCSRGGRIFAKENGKYIMLNTNGKQIGNDYYDDVKPFLSEQYAAVKKGLKWGFVDVDGKMAIDCKYEDATSFKLGIAGVKGLDGWSIIDQNSEQITAPSFTDIICMNSKGILTVKRGTVYMNIKLYAFMNNK